MTIRAKVEENESGWIWVWLTMENSKAEDRTYQDSRRYNMGCFQVMAEDKKDLEALLGLAPSIVRKHEQGGRMSFHEQFNEWLVAQGKEPVDDEMGKILDDAAIAAADFMRTDEAKKALVSGFAEIIHRFKAGEAIDPATIARRKLDKAEQAIREGDKEE